MGAAHRSSLPQALLSKPVEEDEQLLETIRYIVRNPVRAGLCATPEHWRWSSHRVCAGLDPAPAFLAVDFVHGLFGGRREEACLRYRTFVQDGQLLVSDTKLGGADG